MSKILKYEFDTMEKLNNLDKLDDNEKLELISQLIDEEEILIVLMSLEDDKTKIELINLVSGELQQTDVIKTLKSDELKIQMLDVIQDEFCRSVVIDSIKDVNKKYQIVMETKDASERAIYASTLPYNLQLNVLQTLNLEKNKVELISVMKTDEQKIENIKKLKDKIYILEAVKSLDSDEEKLKYLPLCEGEEEKVEIIISLKDDDKKLGYLESFKDEYEKARIIGAIEDEEKKLKEIEKLTDVDNARVALLGTKYREYAYEIYSLIKGQATTISFEELLRLCRNLYMANKALKHYPKELTNDQKIRLGFAIENREDRNQFLNDNTNFARIHKEIEDSSKKHSTNLDLPEDMTIGVELEVSGISLEIGKQLLEEDFVKRNLDGWKAVYDGSIIEEGAIISYDHKGRMTKCDCIGVEFVSPILTTKKESMRQIDYIFKLLNTIGATATESCGGHIHIGANYFASNMQAWQNFLNIWKESEEIIYKICNDVGEIITENRAGYALPQVDFIDDTIDDFDGSVTIRNTKDYNDKMDLLGSERMCSLNLSNLKDPNKHTIEFRASNEPQTEEIEKQNILLYGRIMQRAKEMVNNPNMQKKLELLSEHYWTEAEKVDAFLNLMFDNNEEKNIYYRRWESCRDNEIFDFLKSARQKFERGNYNITPRYKQAVINMMKSINNENER